MKQETLEKKFVNIGGVLVLEDDTKSQQSYSEEEVLDITKQAYAMGRSNYTIEAFNNWLKQFKKK